MMKPAKRGEAQQAQEPQVEFVMLPKPFLYDQNTGCKPQDKLVLQILIGATWVEQKSYATTKQKQYRKLSYREISELSGVCASVLCSTGAKEGRDVKHPREGIIPRLARLGYIRMICEQEIEGKGSRVLYIWVESEKIWSHVPQSDVRTKAKKEPKYVRSANAILPFPTHESANEGVRTANEGVRALSTNEEEGVRASSTKVGGNTSIYITNTPPNTCDPQQCSLPNEYEEGGEEEKEQEELITGNDYLNALVSFLSSKERQDDPVPPTLVTPVPEVPLPIARDTTSKEEKKELVVPIEQGVSGYKKLEIHSVSDIPESWTLEEMEQWFASLPNAIAAYIYHSDKCWTKILDMHQRFSPDAIILTYGYMAYCDPHWATPGKTVNIIAVSSCIDMKNSMRKGTPEERIFAEMGIALLPHAQDTQEEVPSMLRIVEEFPSNTDELPVVQQSQQQPYNPLDEMPEGTKYAKERIHLLQIGVYTNFCDVVMPNEGTIKGSQSQWETWAYDLPDVFFADIYQAVCQMVGVPALD